MMEWQSETAGDPREFMDTLRIDLFEDEVFVFTPKGEVKSLPAGSTPIDFAYAVHTDVGAHCVGAKVNGRIVPLHTRLNSGDIVEIITSRSSRGPSRDWLGIATTPRARQKIRQHFRREQREDSEHSGRDLLQETLRRQGLPAQKLLSSDVFPRVVKDLGYQKADDLYAALGSGRIPVRAVVNKVLQRSGGEKAAVPEVEMLPTEPKRGALASAASSEFGITVEGMSDIVVRMAKCCKPIPGDEILGYISLGKGVTIHRRNARTRAPVARQEPRAFHDGELGGSRRRRPSASRSRSRRSTATTCSKTSPARCPTRASTSSARRCRRCPTASCATASSSRSATSTSSPTSSPTSRPSAPSTTPTGWSRARGRGGPVPAGRAGPPLDERPAAPDSVSRLPLSAK